MWFIPGRELHEIGHVENWVEAEEEWVPESDGGVECQEVDFEVWGDLEDDWDEECQGSGGHHHHKRLPGEHAEHQGTDGLSYHHLEVRKKLMQITMLVCTLSLVYKGHEL